MKPSRGYHHLIRQPRDLDRETYAAIREAALAIAAACPPRMCRPPFRVDAPPLVTKRWIDHGHVNGGLLVQRTRGPKLLDPKGHPVGDYRGAANHDGIEPRIDAYERYVGAVLAALEGAFDLPLADTAWTEGEWGPSIELARTSLPALAAGIGTPRVAVENDRWCGPYLHLETDRYDLRFCVDGRAYAMRAGDGTSRAFADHAACARWLLRDERTKWWTEGRPWFVKPEEVAAYQETRLAALFEFGDAVERIVDAAPPETAGGHESRRSFTQGLEKLVEVEAKFASMAAMETPQAKRAVPTIEMYATGR